MFSNGGDKEDKEEGEIFEVEKRITTHLRFFFGNGIDASLVVLFIVQDPVNELQNLDLDRRKISDKYFLRLRNDSIL